MNCPNCKQVISPSARFCGNCGQVLEFPAASVSGVAQSAGVAILPAATLGGGATQTGAADAAHPAGVMPGLIERIKNIMLSPAHEWSVIASEPASVAKLYATYVAPLAAFVALMTFAHLSLVGMSVPFAGLNRVPVEAGLGYALIAIAMSLLGVFMVGLIINGLAPTFAANKDRRQALTVAAYSLTSAWLSSLLALSPILPTLLQLLAGLYGIYVLYLGLPIVMRCPRDRALGYTVTVVVCTIVLALLLGALSATAGHFGLAGRMTDVLGADLSPEAAAREQGAATVGNIIGNALGTDEKGKAGLTAALSNLAKADQQNEQQTANPAAATTDSVANSAAAGAGGESSQTPAAATGGLLTALGGALGGSHRVTVVDIKTLTALLPASLPGMKRRDAKGEVQGAVGVKTSSASANYEGEDGGTMHLEISDMSGLSGLMDMAGALVQNTTSESDAGFERDQVMGGRSVHEKYDRKAKKGELTVMLAKRFQVDITGDGVDMTALEQALAQVDLVRLESMKDQGAQAR